VSLFANPAPRWFTIPAHRPFAEDLARGIHDALSPGGPEALADAIVLTPTRRGARALADAFLRAAGGKAVLLPQIRAVGDLDEGEPPFEPGALSLAVPAAISPLRRRFELARLIAEHEAAGGRSIDAPGAIEMADALGAFLDSAQIEETLDPDAIEGLVEGDLARHWRRSAAFLAVATRRWPERLHELGLIDPTARRVQLLRLLAEQWTDDPPRTPLIAAGSTGTAPATADLLGVVACAPQGLVVLPGLDLDLAEDAWRQVGEQHPQGAMKRLIERHGLNRADIAAWPLAENAAEAARGRSRRRIVNEALRPAEATADWRVQIEALRREGESTGVDPVAEGLQGLSVAAVRTEEEAATVAALLLREALETPGLTAALVTPDQALARRVSARLARWGVEADSSAGASLASFPTGTLLGLLSQAAVEPMEPAGLLGLLKHPWTRLGADEEGLTAAREAIERYALRGSRCRDWAALDRRLDGYPEAADVAHRLQAVFDRAAAPFAHGDADATVAARALAEAAEQLCTGPDGETGGLWAGASGEAAAALLAGLIEEGEALPPVTAAGFAALIASLLDGETVRTGGSTHPRLRILGAIEARLVRADRLILAGLEEGVWPQGAPIDPFLSRPMREKLGLPPPERRIGLSAHDFAQAACAKEVVLLHSERRGGQPAVQSRWLWRLSTLARGAGVELPERPEVLAWARALDAPDSETPRYAPRPMPRPPVEVRPRSLYVTRIERWVRDPYAIYAQRVLNLEPMDRPDTPTEARARGNAVHKALERLSLEHPHVLPEQVETLVESLLIESLEDEGFGGAALARERPLLPRSAAFIVAFERRRRTEGLSIFVEQTGAFTFNAPAGKFTVKAKADRIEVIAGQGAVIDFKTGRAPTKDEMSAGFAPQLTLTGAILSRGGFELAGPASPAGLIYVRVTGRRSPGEELIRAGGEEAAALSEEALEGLRRRVERFDDPDTPYASWAAPQFMTGYSGDYDHLARVREWAVVGGDETEGAGE
jgi:ATP-dependent helicase/nuclease subunit B